MKVFVISWEGLKDFSDNVMYSIFMTINIIYIKLIGGILASGKTALF
ncbi:MAG: hypothetical protein L6265_10815 [Thermoplasmatales archaeon]|nr:hypothetical protein [Thermoplasmatales archaeon]